MRYLNTEPGLELGDGTRGGGLWVPASVYQDQTIRILGVPGQGKTVLVSNLILQEHNNGTGCINIEHKESVMTADLALRADPARTHVIAPGIALAEGKPVSLNIFDAISDPEEIVGCVLDLAERADAMRTVLNAMPKIQKYLTMTLRLIAGLPDVSLATMIDLLEQPRVRAKYLAKPGPLAMGDDRLLQRWQTYDGRGRKRDGEQSATQLTEIESTINRIDALIGSPVLKAWSTGRTNLPIMEWLNRGDLVLLDLATGINPRVRLILANIVMSTLISMAYGRSEADRSRHIRIAVDEFDQLAPKTFTLGIQKLRSAGVGVLANHQGLDQLESELGATLSGAPLQIFFRSSATDQAKIRRLYSADIGEDIANLPRYSGMVYLPSDEGGEELWEEVDFPNFAQPRRDEPIRYVHRELTDRSDSCITKETAYDDNRPTTDPATGPARPDPRRPEEDPQSAGAGDDRPGHDDPGDALAPPLRDQPHVDPGAVRRVAGYLGLASPFGPPRPRRREHGD